MQFQLFAEQALRTNQQYQTLRAKLISQQQKCLATASNPEQSLQCKNACQHFESYLNEYIYQFREKGRKICSQAIKRGENIEQKMKIKNECVQFYNKSLEIFQDNVKGKLKSLVQKIDFSQL